MSRRLEHTTISRLNQQALEEPLLHQVLAVCPEKTLPRHVPVILDLGLGYTSYEVEQRCGMTADHIRHLAMRYKDAIAYVRTLRERISNDIVKDAVVGGMRTGLQALRTLKPSDIKTPAEHIQLAKALTYYKALMFDTTDDKTEPSKPDEALLKDANAAFDGLTSDNKVQEQP